jgi:hypothetical protein
MNEKIEENETKIFQLEKKIEALERR